MMLLKFELDRLNDLLESAENTAAAPKSCEAKFEEETVTATFDVDVIRPAAEVERSLSVTPVSDNAAVPVTDIRAVLVNGTVEENVKPESVSVPLLAAAKANERDATAFCTVALQSVRDRDSAVHRKSDE
jgi:hypothetical protein